MQGTQIVVYDPADEYWEGSLVEDNRAAQLEARGVVLLPVEASLFKLSGVGAYHRRAWGAGYPLSNATPRMNCPLTIFVVPECHSLHWVARLVPDPHLAVDPTGTLRIVIDSDQPGGSLGGFSMVDPGVDCSKLGPPDNDGGWQIGGKACIYPSHAGHAGLALYGSAPGLRVAWAAVSLAR